MKIRLRYFLYLVVLFSIFINACKSRQFHIVSNGTTKTALDYGHYDSLIVIYENDSVLSGAQFLGTISNRIYLGELEKRIIHEAKFQALKMGGNVLKITRVYYGRKNWFSGKFFKLDMNVYYYPDLNYYSKYVKEKSDLLKRIKFGDHPNYALLYVYPNETGAPLFPMAIRMNDTVLCQPTGKDVLQIKLYKEGNFRLWAKTLSAETDKAFEVEFGKEYYLRFGMDIENMLNTLIIFRTPTLYFMDNHQGKRQYLNAKKNKDHLYSEIDWGVNSE